MEALRVTYAIWLREIKLFVREPTRLVGMIGQPLLYLLIVGQGIAAGLTLKGRRPAWATCTSSTPASSA